MKVESSSSRGSGSSKTNTAAATAATATAANITNKTVIDNNAISVITTSDNDNDNDEIIIGSSMIYWVQISQQYLLLMNKNHFQDNNNNNNNGMEGNNKMIWWPCLMFHEYTQLYNYFMDDDDEEEEEEDIELKGMICQRNFKNCLEGKKFVVAQLFGRPLMDCVELIHPISVHDANLRFEASSLHLHQTLSVKEFHQMNQDVLLEQTNPNFFHGNDSTLYLNYMKALDMVQRCIANTADHATSIALQASGQGFNSFVSLGKYKLEQQQKQNDDNEENVNQCVDHALAVIINNTDTAKTDRSVEGQETNEPNTNGSDRGYGKSINGYGKDSKEKEDQQGDTNVEREDIVRMNDTESASTPKHVNKRPATNIVGGVSSSSETVVTQESEDSHQSVQSPSPTQTSPKHMEEEEILDPDIESDDTFEQVIHKLQLTLGWEEIMYNGETIYLQSGYDPTTNLEAVRGQHYFNEMELKDYLKTKYGWEGNDNVNNNNTIDVDAETDFDSETTPKRLQTIGYNNKGINKKVTRQLITPSPPTRRSQRQSRGKRIYGLESMHDTPIPMKKKKTFHFKSEEEEEFYDFCTLIRKLEDIGWQYKSGNLSNWNYVRPGRKGEKRGGKYMEDFFREEEEVIGYCMKHKYYENRHKLGLGEA